MAGLRQFIIGWRLLEMVSGIAMRNWFRTPEIGWYATYIAFVLVLGLIASSDSERKNGWTIEHEFEMENCLRGTPCWNVFPDFRITSV